MQFNVSSFKSILHVINFIRFKGEVIPKECFMYDGQFTIIGKFIEIMHIELNPLM